MKPSISVVMPVYQVEKYLKASLDSIRNQTLADIEIICVDDGSTDNCPSILDNYALEDQRIKVIHNTNHGYGFSVNCGFQNASGEYLAILEPDDLMPATALETLYSLAKKYNADLVKGNYCEYYQDTTHGEKLILARLSSSNELYNNVFNARNCPEVLVSQIINCTGIFRRQLIVDKNIRLSETPGASYQDVGLFFSLMIHADSIYFTEKVTYWYRNDNPAASTKNRGKLYMAENEYIGAQEMIKGLSLDRELLVAFWGARWRGFLGTMARIDPSLYEEMLQYMRPIVNEAADNNLLTKKYCNAYQWEMLKQFRKGNSDFIKALQNANGKHGFVYRLLWRFKNDGVQKTIQFLIQKAGGKKE